MPSWMAWVQRPRGLIKMEGSATVSKVDNVSWRRISIINQNCYQIIEKTKLGIEVSNSLSLVKSSQVK
jgi:hypothetical protein